MSTLYPRLSLAIAEAVAGDCAGLSVLDLVSMSGTSHESIRFAPTGGNRVSVAQLEELQKEMRVQAARLGYPMIISPTQAEQFDLTCAMYLHRKMNLYPAEAAHIEMWAFLATILLPDIVRWRFPGESTSLDRFIGGDRGLRRNTFGRLWWRAYLLCTDASGDDAYHLLMALHEDELVQITERPSIATNPLLAQAVAVAHIKTMYDHPHLHRRTLIRDGIKRVRRRMSVICYDLLEREMLQADVNSVFSETAQVIASGLPGGNNSDIPDED